MAPTYKVHYFDFTGRAEPVRLLLSYGGLEFEDIRVPMEDWPKVKPTMPLKQMPVLEVDGKMIPQSNAICRYLANKVKLVGNDLTENVKIDVAVETVQDLQKVVTDYAYEQDEARKKKLEGVMGEKVPFYLDILNQAAGKNGGYIGLDRLTWVDILFLCTYESLGNHLGKDPLADYPNLVKVKENVLAVPAIREWIKKRPTNSRVKFDLKTQL